MSKTLLTIEKEIIKKEYEKSPLGIVEKKLRKLFDEQTKFGTSPLPEDICKQINDIREANENRTEEYIETRLKHDREAVDSFLLESMTKELEILNNFNNKK